VLRDILLELKVEAGIVAPLTALVDALARIGDTLGALTAEYEGWRGLLSELRHVEDALETNFNNLDRAWVDISKTSHELMDANANIENCAEEMARIDSDLQTVLEEQSPVRAREALLKFHELARKCRQRVVGRLLAAADELQRVNLALDGLLQTMKASRL
jgi:hypothetical protein